MKKLSYLLSFTFFLIACNSNKEEKKDTATATLNYYGDTINANGAIASTQLLAQLAGKDSAPLKVEGKISAVCQKKGCWMELDLGNNQTMRVAFKDYKFFVPKDASGKTAIVDGMAHNDTLSIEDQKHYAEDAGKSKEEIAQITKPQPEISFEARGVIIK